eukprot:5061678-Prymnesium_polylepis.1
MGSVTLLECNGRTAAREAQDICGTKGSMPRLIWSSAGGRGSETVTDGFILPTRAFGGEFPPNIARSAHPKSPQYRGAGCGCEHYKDGQSLRSPIHGVNDDFNSSRTGSRTSTSPPCTSP